MLADYPEALSVYLRPSGLLGFESVNAGNRPFSEWYLAHILIALARQGRVDRIRKCICDRWFFGKRVDQESCGSPRCRHKRYEQTDAFRAARKVYMHWRYAVNGSKAWMGIPESKRPTFEQWKEYDEPTPEQWKEILRRQKKGAR